MHWSEKVARRLIENNPNKEEFVCASGISPSGTVTAGNFREYITTYFVVQALKKLGKKARFFYSWDDFDRLRKVPKNIDAPGFENHIGKPYSEIPSPFGDGCYAEHFEKEFESALTTMGLSVNTIRQREMYKSGKYANQIIDALKRRKEIYDVIMSFKTQEATEEDRENYYPVKVYCSKCGKDSTKVVSLSEDCTKLTYECSVCGHTETVDLNTWHMLKLEWKVDWPMRWIYEGVDFEPGGRDHSTPGGSYDVCSHLVREIWGKEPPAYQKYEWIGIAGMGQMHSSSGMNVSPSGLLNIYEPEVFLWLYAKYDPEEEFNFAFDQTIQRQYAEYDKMLEGYMAGTLDEYNTAVMELALNGKQPKKRVGFGTLASLAPLVNYNRGLLETILKKMGHEYTAETAARFDKVEYWLKNFGNPETFELCKEKNVEYFNTLSEEDKQNIKKLYDFLSQNKELTEQEIQQGIYDIVNDPSKEKKENQANQQKYFKNIYNLLFAQDKGPRLYLYFVAIDKKEYLHLFDF